MQYIQELTVLSKKKGPEPQVAGAQRKDTVLREKITFVSSELILSRPNEEALAKFPAGEVGAVINSGGALLPVTEGYEEIQADIAYQLGACMTGRKKLPIRRDDEN